LTCEGRTEHAQPGNSPDDPRRPGDGCLRAGCRYAYGDFDEARFLAMTVAGAAGDAGFPGIAQAAAHLAVALGPMGLPPGITFGPYLVLLADALDEADPRHACHARGS